MTSWLYYIAAFNFFMNEKNHTKSAQKLKPSGFVLADYFPGHSPLLKRAIDQIPESRMCPMQIVL